MSDQNTKTVIIQIKGDDFVAFLEKAVAKALRKTKTLAPTNSNEPKKHLTPRDVEQEYGFKQKLLSYWRLEDMGPPYSIHGKRVFYERKALDKYIKEHSLTPTRVPH